MARFQEIRRLIELGRTDRQIAKALRCRRSLVAKVRAGGVTESFIDNPKAPRTPPTWTLGLDWDAIEKDLRQGFEIKRIWEEYAQTLTSAPNFFKHLKNRFEWVWRKTVTLREFKPGEYCEVDYAGDRLEWLDARTGEIHEAHVFAGVLCYSQKLFAVAHEDEKKANWLDAHSKMLEFYQGVPRVVVPDQLKNGVVKSHLYDPDINPDYVDLAKHYGMAVCPARVRHPKDKALVEGAVRILTRYFKFKYRRKTFTSLTEVNTALKECVQIINAREHSRFKISRDSRYEAEERRALNPLPAERFEFGEWKIAKVHPDCTVAINGRFFSVPHRLRGDTVRVKMGQSHHEIFYNLERVALHLHKGTLGGQRIINLDHLPENSRAYCETTPQNLLSQSKFIHPELHSLVNELFNQDTLGNLRRAQGFIRHSMKLIEALGRDRASTCLVAALTTVRAYQKFRVNFFEECLRREINKLPKEGGANKIDPIVPIDRTIVRKPGNPMVRRGHSFENSHLFKVN